MGLPLTPQTHLSKETRDNLTWGGDTVGCGVCRDMSFSDGKHICYGPGSKSFASRRGAFLVFVVPITSSIQSFCKCSLESRSVEFGVGFLP